MDEFVNLVEKMREAQRNYFRARRQQRSSDSDHFLIESKRYEREVDELIEKFKQDKAKPKLF